jgi:hypothetical protein
VWHPRFGLTHDGHSILSNPDNLIDQILLKSKPMDFLEAKELLYEAYDNTFGIFDHVRQAQLESRSSNADQKRPLASVALHPAEDWAGVDTQLEKVLKGFADNNVKEIFGIGIDVFLNLPVEYAQRIMRISKAVIKRKDTQLGTAENLLVQASKGK